MNQQFWLLLSAKTLKCTIYHPGALINRTSGFSFPNVSPSNQTGSVLEAFPLRFEPSLPNLFRGLQEKYSSLHNTWAWFLSLLPIRKSSRCVLCAFVWPSEEGWLWVWPKFVPWWRWNFHHRSISTGSFALIAWTAVLSPIFCGIWRWFPQQEAYIYKGFKIMLMDFHGQ